ncbi:uncharacterized protein BP5553_02186 [Venustampulla echinocandica]|uniref:Uncharacterized protein n=1 Tax=Venustampulla echinocandica TaxID=2656787 RepID=A0A370U362_9HELO|nr:uncharacterized protein BP5553_02186 [Venustampulla echinocandica]RDL42207.1 hypothetical protein BP5553_02186 [Venustampulla echinocandica]
MDFRALLKLNVTHYSEHHEYYMVCCKCRCRECVERYPLGTKRTMVCCECSTLKVLDNGTKQPVCRCGHGKCEWCDQDVEREGVKAKDKAEKKKK